MIDYQEKPLVGSYIAEGKAKGIDLSGCNFVDFVSSNPEQTKGSLEFVKKMMKQQADHGAMGKKCKKDPSGDSRRPLCNQWKRSRPGQCRNHRVIRRDPTAATRAGVRLGSAASRHVTQMKWRALNCGKSTPNKTLRDTTKKLNESRQTRKPFTSESTWRHLHRTVSHTH